MAKSKFFIGGAVLLFLAILSGIVLSAPIAHAEDTGFSVQVLAACSLVTSNTSLTKTANPGDNVTIGESNLKALCNDPAGFAIYVVGYTDNTYGKNVLSTPLTTTEHSYDITTGIAGTPTASQWNMTIIPDSSVANNYTSTITNDFNVAHIIPTTYTKAVSSNAVTDQTIGANLKSQFNIQISTDQPASTYSGKVKFTLVHPSAHATPATPVAVPGQICYYGNGEDEGSMACQTTIDIGNSTTALSANAEAQLRASNFSRAGYGFTGWNTKEDGSGTQYGPMETIVFTEDMNADGLVLFANWKAAETGVTMQTFDATASPYSTMANDTVIALRDERDNDVYAVAKLADGNWWMIENLRLDYDANITTSNTQSNNGSFGGVFNGLAEPETANFSDSTTPNSLYATNTASTDLRVIAGDYKGYRFPRYSNTNTSTRASSPTTSSAKIYSYGNYYTWSAAIADTENYTTGNQSITNTSL